MGVMRPKLVMKSIVLVVMAGVLGIYGLIIAVIIILGLHGECPEEVHDQTPEGKPAVFSITTEQILNSQLH
ncbi:hypothetical protein L1987_14564 [Smallanthus sonchifolius]|uniref:Uncharacterized protein n=1 Tax=Smallanthus sonchifolius TaxID=185202 RepID=A0ACB9J569_9ASTR|nr:hypothetical protein L1987_14564 [Smallanthus sonchifolius]